MSWPETSKPFVDVLSKRRMVRNYDGQPVEPNVVDSLLDLARRAPSAGFSQGTSFIVLEGEHTQRFWSCTLPEEQRPSFPWPGLLDAPVIILPMADERVYRARYAEPDKVHTGLGDGDWAVPYWQIDTAMATMNLLNAVVDAGLGALFFAIFRGETELLADLGVPDGVRPIGAVTVGHPAQQDRLSKSTKRGRVDLDQVVHRGGW